MLTNWLLPDHLEVRLFEQAIVVWLVITVLHV
jgi:hypothetical protein